MRIALFTHSAEQNGLGRAYCLWLLARELGWEVEIVAPEFDSAWEPLSGQDEFLKSIVCDPEGAAEQADVLVALKPWPGSFDKALELGGRLGRPVVLDVDDPDWESAYGWNSARVFSGFLKRTVRGRPPWREYRLRRRAKRAAAILVSNPSLQRWYGDADVIPHVRAPREPGAPHTHDRQLEVAFVGSVRAHKGVEVLREAVRRAGDIHLTITDEAPDDAEPHETWVGVTSFEEGLELVDRADVVALPSLSWVYSFQLPVKLVDAMLSGRAVVASDLPALRWALDGNGVLVEPGDVDSLAEALGGLRDPARRQSLGDAARGRALAAFTPASVAAGFATVFSNLL